ncbi:MAG TPA: hypothetical protein VHR72_10030, partial [Gemmataceae bacterium]|nr:hypothetical protein [Gemmataceae bacterium]
MGISGRLLRRDRVNLAEWAKRRKIGVDRKLRDERCETSRFPEIAATSQHPRESRRPGAPGLHSSLGFGDATGLLVDGAICS